VRTRNIEEKELFPNLQSIDNAFFSDMPHRTYLHLGVHDRIVA
jgi:hypothetical protein